MNTPIWVERYRPHKIEDCILPIGLKETFKQIVQQKTVPNMILAGKQGGGKTTVARAICDELGIDYLMINASENGNIDTLRIDIRNYAATKSFNSSRKVVILDEADYLNPNSTQPALRSFIEEFASNSSFIFTCNILNKIIGPLHSRASVIEFTIPNAEKVSLQTQFYKRVKMILDTEKIEFTPNVVKTLIVKYWPDYRRVINELQRYSYVGKIDEGILDQVQDAPISELIVALKARDFKTMRKWCAINHDSDSVKTMRKIYDALYEIFTKECIPAVVLLIAEYQFKAAFVQDQEINLTAFLTELMETVDFVE
jgi:DNA polymerase III delta prime subunit